MRRPVLATILAALFVACGGGAEKEAFERYEQSVAKVLEQEAELRAQYDEELRNVSAYGDETDFETLVKTRMIPFYADMREEVAAVVPESDDLKAIHLYLMHYVKARGELFELDDQAASVTETQKPALQALDEATRDRDKKTGAFNKAVTAAPTLVNKLAPLFGEEQGAVAALFKNLDAVRSGKVEHGAFLIFIDTKLVPFYEQLDQGVDTLELGEAGADVIRTAKEYIASTRKVIAAARALTEVLKGLTEDLQPIQQKFLGLLEKSDGLLKTYRTEAKAYRDSLR